jgi:hypothetical protein
MPTNMRVGQEAKRRTRVPKCGRSKPRLALREVREGFPKLDGHPRRNHRYFNPHGGTITEGFPS